MSIIPIYGPESRKLSPREFKGYNHFQIILNMIKKTIYKQVGNAVNVTMIEKCARFLILNENLF